MSEDLEKLGTGEADVILLHDGTTLRTHGPAMCEGDEACCIHRPSDHPLKNAPLNWREAGPFDIKPSHMERICPHGIGHPDPDALAHTASWNPALAYGLSQHGCDRCCTTGGLNE